MPCRSDYLEPTQYERLIQETAKLLLWFIGQADIHYKGTQIRIKKVAKDAYPSKEDGDFVVALLCKELRNLQNQDKAKFESIVYARSKEARELANWWEDHEKADNKRINKEAEKLEKVWEKFYNKNDMSNITSSPSMTRGVVQWFIDNGYDVPTKNKEFKS